MAREIYNRDGMHPVDRETAVEHIGYSSLNGASATALASIKQYGLIEDAGKGMLKLTSLALDMLEPESEEGRDAALLKAAFSPSLFETLQGQFPGRVPSESNLRAYLLRNEFTQAAVKSVVPAYLETCEYIAENEESERTGKATLDPSESAQFHSDEETGMNIQTREATQFVERRPAGGSGKRMVFDTVEGEVMFTYPDNLSAESIEDLEEWFALVTKRLKRAASS